MDREKKPKINWRGFTTFVVSLSFIVMVVSGVILYLTPSGRIARWTDWTVLGLNKDIWVSVHMNSCILFIVIALVHLYLNWRVFLRYFKSKVEQGFCLKREFLLACVVCGLFVAGSIWYLSPFNTVFNIREDFKFAHDPIFTREQLPGAEELTLARLAGQIGVKPEEMAGVLKENGLKVENPKATVSEIAMQNGLPPAAVYEAVYLKYGQYGHPVTRFTGLNPEGRGEGRGQGFGRMTLSELCAQQGLKTETVIASLQNRGVQATEFSTLRDLSLALGTTPREVLQIVQTGK